MVFIGCFMFCDFRQCVENVSSYVLVENVVISTLPRNLIILAMLVGQKTFWGLMFFTYDTLGLQVSIILG